MAFEARNDGGTFQYIADDEADLAAIPNPQATEMALAQSQGTLWYHTGTVWAQIGAGGGAPTDADYLVGTANASLTAEIVVGATPGGELGGTWAAPTVDATHSGTAHHAQSHVLATGTALGPDQTMSGAAAGEVLRALSATTAAFDVLAHADLGTVTADQHHAQLHAAAQHNAAALPGGFNEALGAAFLDSSEIGAPATPAANTIRAYSRDKAGVSEWFYKNDGGTERDLSAVQNHSIIGATHTAFPGGTTTFLRADATFAAPTAVAADLSYSPGSFTVVTETVHLTANHVKLTTTQRVILQGTGRWSHYN